MAMSKLNEVRTDSNCAKLHRFKDFVFYSFDKKVYYCYKCINGIRLAYLYHKKPQILTH